VAAVDSIAQLGATFYVAEKEALRQAPGTEEALRQRYPVTAEGAWTILFDLRHTVTLHTP
jgi:hypothetical protein